MWLKPKASYFSRPDIHQRKLIVIVLAGQVYSGVFRISKMGGQIFAGH